MCGCVRSKSFKEWDGQLGDQTGDHVDEPQEKKAKHGGLDAHVQVACVQQSRMAHTCVTSTWADGTPGPLVFFFSEGSFSAKAIAAINKKFRGKAWASTTGRVTHFMCAATTDQMYEECYGIALALQR